MRILLTGCAGFIGSHLARYLVNKDHDVVGIDNLITGGLKNIKGLYETGRFRFINSNVSEYINVSGRVDAVLHFASPASPVDYLRHPIPTLKVGALGTHNALGVAKAKKAVFMLASTSEVYGDPLVSPQPETYWGNVNPVGPRGVYDEAKRFAEAMTMAYHRVHGLQIRIARVFNTYGPGMRPDDGRAIPNFITQALTVRPLTVYGKGTQTRSFMYIADLTEGLYRLLVSRYNGPVNLGNPDEMTLLELAKIIKEITGSKSKIVLRDLPVDDPRERCPDIRLAKNIFHWHPKIALKEGLTETIDYFREVLAKSGSRKKRSNALKNQ
ncbi:MAG: SDR family oxidoreductase [Elusimicrobia bacterium]|nr:SDR family oxidoreductase [Elusimicrobiota bacterium]